MMRPAKESQHKWMERVLIGILILIGIGILRITWATITWNERIRYVEIIKYLPAPSAVQIYYGETPAVATTSVENPTPASR